MSSTNELLQTDDIMLTPEAMQNIYSKLSINEDTPFDIVEENKFVEKCIDECFDLDFKQISTKKLQEDAELINNSFVKLIKYCVAKKFKKCGIIYIGFCDYFDLDYNKTFLNLHEKLQKLIKYTCQCMVGIKCYDKYNKKSNNGIKIKTLFDLYQKT